MRYTPTGFHFTAKPSNGRIVRFHRDCSPLESIPEESVPEVLPELPPQPPREPLLTLPGALIGYILLLAIIHLRVLLPPDLANWTVEVFGFIPKRYDATLLTDAFAGGEGAKFWTFVTYSLLHANLTHIGFNVLWLLPFGSALARRFGAVRFFVFMAVTAAAGALAYLIADEHDLAPMIGASASVSGAMAAAIRFAFVQGSFLPSAAAMPTPLQKCRRSPCGEPCTTVVCLPFSPSGLASTSSSALGRLGQAWKTSKSPGRRILAAFSPDFCCFRCSIRFLAPQPMLQMRRRRIRCDPRYPRLRGQVISSIIRTKRHGIRP